MKKVKITGTGSYLPEIIITNKLLEGYLDTSDEWIQKTLGIKERRITGFNEMTSDLAYKAGRRAIFNARLNRDEIDLIIVATSTPDRKCPSTACIVQDRLKAYNAAAFDINAVCSGFLFGLSVACQYISNGTYKNVLVIGADTFSKITDWKKRDCVFFGDGAGAVVLSEGDEGFLAFRLYSDGRGKDAFTVRDKNSYFEMDGRAVYDTGIKVLPEAINQVLKDAKLKITDIDYMIPHQPSIGILKETAKIIGLPFKKVKTNMDRYANTSAGTIPILLDELNRAGEFKKNEIILFAAVGSGWTWGASILKWS